MKLRHMWVIVIIFVLPLSHTLSVKIMADEKPTINIPRWQEALLQERKEKDLEYKTSPTSPITGVKRLTITNDSQTKQTDQTNQTIYIIQNRISRDVSLSRERTPDFLFSLVRKDKNWAWNKNVARVTATQGNTSTQLVQPGILPGKPVVFHCEEIAIQVYPSDNGLVLLVFDSFRPGFKEFSHLLYYPPNPDFAVTATLKKFPTPEKITIPTSQKQIKTYFRYATVHFKLEGREWKLTALKSSLTNKEEAAYLFIPFADATSGKETYEVGRFLEIKEPDQPQFILDFNRCFNPLCNYSPAYNCPIPPLENYLDVPINAGEKTYPITH